MHDFIPGNKGHMAFVTKININDTSDPYYETIGLVTMEDVLEELIQAEINDETDILGNSSRKGLKTTHKIHLINSTLCDFYNFS